jgi:hypothetical protein
MIPRPMFEKQQNLIGYAENVPIEIEYIPFEDIVMRAVNQHNSIMRSNHKTFHAVIPQKTHGKSNPLVRAAVRNYVRHRLSNYDVVISKIAKSNNGKNVNNRCCEIAKKRFNAKINELWQI